MSFTEAPTRQPAANLIRRLWKQYRSAGADRYSRRLMLLSSGTMLAQLLIIGGSPLLTRIYSPAEFGAFAVLSAWISILGPLACVGLETPILIEQDDRRARSLTTAALLAGVVTTALLVLCLALLELSPWAPSRSSVMGQLVWLLPLGIFAYALTQPLTHWSLREGAEALNSLTQVAQAISQLVGQVTLGLASLGALGLCAGYVVGLLPRLVWHAAAARASFWQPLDCVGSGHLLAAVRREWRYPVIATPSALLRLASQFLPTVIVTALYGAAVGGLFGLGQRILTAPVRMLGLATSQALLTEVGSQDRAGLRRLFTRTIVQFAMVGLAWVIPLAVAAPSLFEIAFGTEWRMGGEMVRALLPLHFARFVLVPVSQLLNVINRHDLDLALAVVLVTTLAASFGAAVAFDLRPLMAVTAFSLSSCFVYLMTMIITWSALREDDSLPAK